MRRIWMALCVVGLLSSSATRSQTIVTVAGGGTRAYTALNTDLAWLTSVAVSPTGNLYVVAPEQEEVLKVSPSGAVAIVAGVGYAGYSGDATGIITTIVGNGTAGFSGDGGPAISAEINQPRGVAFDPAGNLYICDTENNRIRRVDAKTGIITTYAGNGTAGFSGDGGPATDAALDGPLYLSIDGSGDVFVGDTTNNRIREIVPRHRPKHHGHGSGDDGSGSHGGGQQGDGGQR